MSTENLQSFINGIIDPNISQVIREYSTYPEKRQYESIVAILCDYAKEFAFKEINTPYIQLKDDKGNFVYNNRLSIEVIGDKEKLRTPKEKYSVNIIDDMKDKRKVFCMLTYFSDKGRETSFGGITFPKDKSEIGLLEYVHAAGQSVTNEIAELQEQGHFFGEEIKISFNFLFHHYDENTQTWTIQSPFDTIRIMDDSEDL